MYLLAEHDIGNKVMISDDQILVVYKKKRTLFTLKSIKSLKTERIKLLFPLVLGGIITPFAFLSFFVNLFYPWIHLTAIMLGLLLFYTGWSGKYSFTIVFKNGDEIHHYLTSISNNLEAFIDFVNTQRLKVSTINAPLLDALFFELDKKHEDVFFGQKNVNQTLFPIFGYTYQQLHKLGKSISDSGIICINPVTSGREIKFHFDLNTNMMRPRLEGPVNKDSKINSAKNP